MTDELVSVAVIAQRAGRPSDTVEKWIVRHSGHSTTGPAFPPCVKTDPRVWSWRAVSQWLHATGRDHLAPVSRGTWIEDPPVDRDWYKTPRVYPPFPPRPVKPESGWDREMRLSREADKKR